MRKKVLVLAISLVMVLTAAAIGLAQTEASVQGFITNISGNVVLVEENPADQWESDKGYFTVTGETEILRQEGDSLVPATVEDLQVGNLVVATYSGPVMESYPPQGAAGSIVILEDLSGDDELLCLLPEGCDLNGDGVPDLGAGDPVPDENTGFEQYSTA